MNEEDLRGHLGDCVLTVNTITCEECYANRSNYSEEYLIDFIITEGWNYLDDKVLCSLCAKEFRDGKVTP